MTEGRGDCYPLYYFNKKRGGLRKVLSIGRNSKKRRRGGVKCTQLPPDGERKRKSHALLSSGKKRRKNRHPRHDEI